MVGTIDVHVGNTLHQERRWGAGEKIEVFDGEWLGMGKWEEEGGKRTIRKKVETGGAGGLH